MLGKRNIHLKSLLRDIKGYKAIKRLNLFDENFYNKHYKFNESKLIQDSLIHYIYYGYKEGKNPSKNFDTKYYLGTYPNVKKLGINPLIHYAISGIYEGKRTTSKSIQKDTKKYIIERNHILISNEHLSKSKEKSLVSIIILNLNGIKHLKRLFKNFDEKTGYSNYEIIVIDNGSSDDSLSFLEKKSEEIPIKIIKNKYNKTFSEANNQGVKEANGEYILLLNNDIEPTPRWISEMISIMLNKDNVGSVGAKLIYPKYKNTKDKKKSFKVQHGGIGFKVEGDNFRAYNLYNGKNAFDSSLKTEIVPGASAATLLIKKSLYLELGGLDEKYNYGYEDVDLALKLVKAGYDNYLCSTALLFHHESSTQEKDSNKVVSERRKRNFDILNKKWGSYLFKNILSEKITTNNFLTEEKLKIGIVVSKMSLSSISEDTIIALELAKELKSMGYEIIFINKKEKIKNPNIDILINLLYNYNISELNLRKNIIKIAWIRNLFDEWVNNKDINDYDIYTALNDDTCKYIDKKLGYNSFLMPITTNHNRLKELFKIGTINKSKSISNKKISIKISASKKMASLWGDYHFALALKKEFKKKFHESEIVFLEKWGEKDDSEVVMVLRGLFKYKANPKQLNIMWNISHPDMVDIDEYNEYDHIFVASDSWAKKLENELDVGVTPLIQCTDPKIFYPEYSEGYSHEILFVGNSRMVFRKIIKDLLPTKYELGLYGSYWDNFVSKDYISGEHIENRELHKAYSSCKILLNDHWDDMAEKGFISNRLFDGFASGAFIISDQANGLKNIFGDSIITYSDKNDLTELIDFYMKNEKAREEKSKVAKEIVLKNHTFEKRVETILNIINQNNKK